MNNDIVSKCIKIESSPYIESNNTKIYTNTGYIISTNYNLYYDICASPMEIKESITYIENDTFVLNKNNVSNINIIITHPLLIFFWENNKNNETIIIDNVSKMNLEKIIKLGKSIIIITKNVFLKKYDELKNFTFNRVFLHNIDIPIKKLKCCFTWICVSNIKKLKLNKKLANLVVCEEEEDICISEKETKYIICKKPIESVTLDGLVDKVVIDHIDSYNIKMALKLLTSPNIKSEEDILKSVLNNLNDKLKYIELREYIISKISYCSEDEKQKRLNSLINIKNKTCTQKNELVQRITTNNICFICYANIEIKTILKCCNNAVCFECINKWQIVNNTCPLCKKPNIEYFIQEETNNPNVNTENIISNDNCLFDNFYILINQLINSKKKIIIISNEKTMITRFERVLTFSEIKFLNFKGNKNMIKKTISSYTNDSNINVLTMNYNNIKTGIPLSNVTDIITIYSEEIELESMYSQCTLLCTHWCLRY